MNCQLIHQLYIEESYYATNIGAVLAQIDTGGAVSNLENTFFVLLYHPSPERVIAYTLYII